MSVAYVLYLVGKAKARMYEGKREHPDGRIASAEGEDCARPRHFGRCVTGRSTSPVVDTVSSSSAASFTATKLADPYSAS